MCAQIFSYAAEQGLKTLETKPVPDVPHAVLSNEPLGVLLAIEPWNYPFLQVARVIGPQLMAGNVLIVKHAENVPQCALALESLFADIDAPPGLYTNLFVDADRVDSLIDDPRVQGVTLTGSERAGSAVAERAGKNLKKSVLELGGTDPFIVLEDAPMDVTLDNAVYARMENTGQSCIAGKRFIIVGESRGREFTEQLVERFKALRPGDLADKDTKFGPLCTQAALDRCLSQIEAAKQAGARILQGGGRIDRPGFYLEPTVIDRINPTTRFTRRSSSVRSHPSTSSGPMLTPSGSPTTRRSVSARRSSPPTWRRPQRWRTGSTAAWCLSTTRPG